MNREHGFFLPWNVSVTVNFIQSQDEIVATHVSKSQGATKGLTEGILYGCCQLADNKRTYSG